MKIKNVLLVLLLFLFIVSIVGAVDWSFECPYVTTLRGGCPASATGGGSNLFAWRDFGSSEELCGGNPLSNHYWECGYTFCGNQNWFSEFHCGGADISGNNCSGMVYETPNPTVLLSPSGQVIFNIQPEGEFQYFVLNEAGTYIVSTAAHPEGFNLQVLDCLSSDIPSLSANVTGTTCFITTSGSCVDSELLTPQCFFTAEPRTGIVPFSVSFKDMSNNIVNYQIAETYRLWEINNSDTFESYSITNPTAKDWSGYFIIPNQIYNVALSVANIFGNCQIFSPRHINTGINNQTSGQYTLIVSPESVSPAGSFSATLSSVDNFQNVNSVLYGWEDELENANVLHDSANSNYILQYSLISGIWYQYSLATMSYSVNVGASFPDTVYSSATFQSLGVENYKINALLHKTTGENIKVSDDLIISNINYQILTIDAKDYLTGGLISGAEIDVLNINTNTWDNKTSYVGSADYNFPYYTPLYIESKATNYITATKNWTVTQLPNYRLWMIMYRGITPPIANVTLHVTVGDFTGGSFLQNALVQILAENVYIGEQSYTSASGTATFTTLENTNYQITVSKTGYQTAAKSINTGAGGQAIEHLIILHRLIATTIPTIIPTVSGGGYQGQIGGNITPAYCQKILPKGSTIVDSFKNDIACAGITSGSNQGYIFAVVIIFVLGIAGGKYGRGMGVVMGMVSGYVISLAMGLIPLWTFIAILIMVGLIFAIKIYGSSDK